MASRITYTIKPNLGDWLFFFFLSTIVTATRHTMSKKILRSYKIVRIGDQFRHTQYKYRHKNILDKNYPFII